MEGSKLSSMGSGHRSINTTEGTLPRNAFLNQSGRHEEQKGFASSDEKFTIGHQCKNCELKVLLVFDDELEQEEIFEEEEETAKVAETIELSLNSVVGLTTPGTMKLKGVIKETEVTVLIDCRATHNFVGSSLVRDLHLPLVTTNSYGVVMETGVAVKGEGIAKGWYSILMMQGLTIVQDFLPLELGSTDVVLGMQW